MRGLSDRWRAARLSIPLVVALLPWQAMPMSVRCGSASGCRDRKRWCGVGSAWRYQNRHCLARHRRRSESYADRLSVAHGTTVASRARDRRMEGTRPSTEVYMGGLSDPHLRATPLLDYYHSRIQELISERNWRSLSRKDAIGAIYKFVRDEIRFGYNETDALPASKVLQDGYGQCNTKSTLLMALLRAVGVPCVLHGATIGKHLQKGIVTGPWYWLAPRVVQFSLLSVNWH
jgi:transglutaminase-like putative cysteine protease